ncbi:MAG TPA: LamG domain-containing protein [Sedimentisphaerales bacterium]|nr:LamG domain-containing protein [Sedimentisphaerales bacterium]
MCRKMIYLVSFILVLSVSGSVCADLVGHWRLDDGSGTVAADSSGNGNDGTIVNNPTWIAGVGGTALEFHGDTSVYGGGDYIDCGNDASLDITGPTSIALWIRPDADDPEGQGSPGGETAPMAKAMAGMSPSWSYQVRYGWGGPEPYMAFTFNTSPRAWAFVGKNLERYEWCHIACSYDGTTLKCYLNGEETDSTPMGAITSSSTPVLIGSDGWGCDWIGAIDDVRIYDHALSVPEIMGAMEGEVWPYALAPKPEDGALHPDTWINLSWLPGGLAVSHDVYVGENFDDVDAGAEGTFQGNQAETFIVVGFPGFPYPDGLVPGTTYYWRIDEVNEAEPNSPWKGDVWSFSVPPKTAYYPDPADAAEQVDPDVTLSWTGGFGSKLHTVYFGDNFDEVSNAAGGLPQGSATYTPGTLKLAKTYYWRVDEFDVTDTHKGDIWSFTTQGAVGSPDPSNGAVDVKQTQILTWTPGVYAASHEVYFGTDKEAVRNADTSSPEYKGAGDLGSQSYEPGKLEWDTTYYWRIDEANNTNPDSPWTGSLWSFTTANFLVVDDFESYNDLDPADPESNRIFNVWLDGYDDPTNGSLVGYENPPFAEQTIVHGGNQSMPVFYDNSVGYSEATLTLTYPRDWTENSVNTLSIWFRGISANAAETLYVALNGSAIVSHDNPNAAQITTWTEWNIDLQAFGINLANVNTIALGLGNKNNPQAGGSGTMYFDDIRLYPPAP